MKFYETILTTHNERAWVTFHYLVGRYTTKERAEERKKYVETHFKGLYDIYDKEGEPSEVFVNCEVKERDLDIDFQWNKYSMSTDLYDI